MTEKVSVSELRKAAHEAHRGCCLHHADARPECEDVVEQIDALADRAEEAERWLDCAKADTLMHSRDADMWQERAEKAERALKQVVEYQGAAVRRADSADSLAAELARQLETAHAARDEALARVRNEIAARQRAQEHGIGDRARIEELEREHQEIIDAAARIVEDRYPEGTTPGDIRRGLARFVKR